MRLRHLPLVLFVVLLLAGCAKDSADERGNPTITVTGFQLFTNVFSPLQPSQPLNLPAQQDAYVVFSATLRDDNQLRGLRIRIDPDFTVTSPSTPTDSVWRLEVRVDTFTRRELTLTNRRFATLNPNLRRSNAANGGPYRLRIWVTDNEGNQSEEYSQRVNVTQ